MKPIKYNFTNFITGEVMLTIENPDGSITRKLFSRDEAFRGIDPEKEIKKLKEPKKCN